MIPLGYPGSARIEWGQSFLYNAFCLWEQSFALGIVKQSVRESCGQIGYRFFRNSRAVETRRFLNRPCIKTIALLNRNLIGGIVDMVMIGRCFLRA